MRTALKLFMCLAFLALLPTTIHAGAPPITSVTDRDGNVLDKDEDAEGAFGPDKTPVDPMGDYNDRNELARPSQDVAEDEAQTESPAEESQPESSEEASPEEASNAEAEPETSAEEDTAQDDASEAEEASEEVDTGEDEDVDEVEDEEDADEEAA